MFLISRSKLLKPNQLRNVSNQIERLFLNYQQQNISSLTSSSSLCTPSSTATGINYCTHTTTNQPKLDTKSVVNPFKLVEDDLKNLYADIRKELWTDKKELSEIASYYFDAQGMMVNYLIE